MEKNISTDILLSQSAVAAIAGLQHFSGVYDYYKRTLDRLCGTFLHYSDELGMSDTETIEILRVLDSIRADLTAIAAKPVPEAFNPVFGLMPISHDCETEAEDTENEPIANEVK